MNTNKEQSAVNDVVALFTQGEFSKAAEKTETFLKTFPESIVLLNIAGAAYGNSGQHDKAIKYYSQALSLNPGYHKARVNLAGSYYENGDSEKAIETCLDILRIEPNNLSALKCLGISFELKEDFEKADKLYRNMMKAFPNDATAFTRLGILQMQVKHYEVSRDLLKEAVARDPTSRTAQIFLYMLNARLCDWDALDAMEAGQAPPLEDVAIDSPYDLVILKDDPQAELECATQHAQRFMGDFITHCPIPKKQSDKRIHVAIVSPDLRQHPCGFAIQGLLSNYNRTKFKFSAFSLTRGDNSEIRSMLKNDFDAFHDVSMLSDSDVVDLARKEGVDIAIDLAGYTQGTRAQVFAKRLAPIQVNMLGYAGTLGAPFYDYIILDPVLVPEEKSKYISETPIYLPDTYWPANKHKRFKDVTSRKEHGLPEDAFVFYCFNRLEKIRREEFDIWMALLNKVDDSVLWILNPNAKAFENLKAYAGTFGVSPDRIIGAKQASYNIHHARQTLGDLFLDNFNYNAHTTAWDAIQAGVPIVTKIGNSFSARVAASILTAADLPELITQTNDEYYNLALKLATDPAALSNMRSKVKRSWAQSAFFDEALYSRNLENGLEQASARMHEGISHNDPIYVKSYF